MDYIKLGKILKNAREEKGIKQKEIAELLNVSSANISSWELGKSKLDIGTFLKVCEKYEINVLSVLSYANEKSNQLSSSNEEKDENTLLIEQLDEIDKAEIRGEMKQMLKAEKYHPKVVIPLYADNYNEETEIDEVEILFCETPASAGTGSFIGDDKTHEKIKINAKIAPQVRRADFALAIKGDSMLPDFQDGDVVFVKEQQTVEHGQIGIFILNDEAYIKKFSQDEKGIALISLNEKYPPIKISKCDSFKICGLVL